MCNILLIRLIMNWESYLFYRGLNMKSIVFLTGSMARGGAERVISLLANHYAKKGWQVSILMLLHNQIEYPLEDQVKVLDLSNERIKAVFDMPRLIYRVRKYVNDNKPNAVIGFMAQISVIAGLACKGLNTRLILSERIDPSAVKRNVLFRKMLNHVYANCSLTVLQTQRAQKYFPAKVQKNSVIIPNPIQIAQKAAEQRRPCIVTAGRLTKQKNHSMLINAFAKLVEKHPEYTMRIFGEGPLRSELQKQITTLGLTEKVKLMGNVQDIHAQIADAEIFVLSSDFEGLSNALLEAMMMGLPCIATNCSGCDEVIEHGKNGLLIHIGDTDALSEGLVYLASEKETARLIGQNAAISMVSYSVDNVIDMWNGAIEG